MGKVLKGVPEDAPPAPEGVVSVNRESGKPEFYYRENVPDERQSPTEEGGAKDDVKNQIF